MYFVHFFENRNLLLCQLLKHVPTVGDDVKIKGRKGKVSDIKNIDEENIHVQIIIETAVNKSKVVVDNSKKKKR